MSDHRVTTLIAGLLVLATLLLAGCAAPAQPAGAEAQSATFSDPAAYCAKVGTIDAPDARYTGAKMPDTLAKALMKASGSSADAPLGMFIQGSTWRCMDGKVYGCFVGANLPCGSKANTSKTPTTAELEFCKVNPNSDFIPEAVTGSETIYEWQCLGSTPLAGRQVFQVDPRGFIANIWYPLTPAP